MVPSDVVCLTGLVSEVHTDAGKALGSAPVASHGTVRLTSRS